MRIAASGREDCATCQHWKRQTIDLSKSYVKSPVASLCFVCSSVRNLVRVMISVLMASEPPGPVCDSLFEGIL
ncbi:hypothetical protein KCU99_g326, partial [Aureobasidium melanogenum]